MTADRQSGLTQQPSSEQNGAEVEVSAEADAVAERKDNVCVIPMKVGGVDVRDRRTAEAEQAEDTNNTILTCCVVPTFANSHGISRRCSLVGQQGMKSAKGEGHPAAHSTAGSSCEGAAQQQAIGGVADAKAWLGSRQSAGRLPFIGCFVAGSIADPYTKAVSKQGLGQLLARTLSYSP